MTQPECDLTSRGRLDPGHGGQRADQVSVAGTVIKGDLSGGDPGREHGQGPGGPGRQVEAGQISGRQHLRGREQPRQAMGKARHRRPEPRSDPAELRARLARVVAFLGHDVLYRRLERAPGTRRPDVRAGTGPGHPGGAARHVNQPLPVRQVGPEQQVILSSRVDLQHARSAIEADRPAVHPA